MMMMIHLLTNQKKSKNSGVSVSKVTSTTASTRKRNIGVEYCYQTGPDLPISILGEHAKITWAVSEKLGRVVLKRAVGEAMERELRAHVILSPYHYDGIIPLLDIFQDHTRCQIMVFPAYSGTLAQFCDKHTMSLKQMANVTRQLLVGLQNIHRHGIVHMDINTTNLLWDAIHSMLVISDFGLAQFDDTVKQPCGTDGYIAPEVNRLFGRDMGIDDFDAKADIFSMGAVFGRMLALHIPELQEIGTTPNTAQYLKIVSTVIAGCMDVYLPPLLLLQSLIEPDRKHRSTIEQALQHDFLHQ